MCRPALSGHSKTRSKDATQVSVRKENARPGTGELQLEAPMVGLIHKILFDLIEETAGREKVLEVKRKAGVEEDKAFRMDEVYDDDEWQRLFSATCAVLGVTQDQAEETYADFFCKDSMKRWPRSKSASSMCSHWTKRSSVSPSGVIARPSWSNCDSSAG